MSNHQSFPKDFKTGLRFKENVPCTLSKHDFVKICNIKKASRMSKKTNRLCQNKLSSFKTFSEKNFAGQIKVGLFNHSNVPKKPLNVVSDAFKIVPNMIFNTLN